MQAPNEPTFNIFRGALVRLVIGERMAVDVEGDLDRRMPHQLLNLFRVIPAFNPQARAGMAQGVHPIFRRVPHHGLAGVVDDRLPVVGQHRHRDGEAARDQDGMQPARYGIASFLG